MPPEPQFKRGPEWVHKMDATLIAPYAIPVAFGRRPHPRETADINAATGSVVDLGETPFLLTAAHVMEAALVRMRESRSHLMLGPVELQLDSHTVEIDPARDLATARLTPKERDTLEADGFYIVRPSAWPPPAPAAGSAVVLAGYPGPWRLQLSWDELDFRSFVILALVHEVRDDEFVCQLDSAYIVETRAVTSEEPPEVALPGLSGSPAFTVSNDPAKLVAPQLCGVVKEGWSLGDGNLIVKYARVDHVSRSGHIGRG